MYELNVEGTLRAGFLGVGENTGKTDLVGCIHVTVLEEESSQKFHSHQFHRSQNQIVEFSRGAISGVWLCFQEATR